jgi:hypothetical protein
MMVSLRLDFWDGESDAGEQRTRIRKLNKKNGKNNKKRSMCNPNAKELMRWYLP